MRVLLGRLFKNAPRAYGFLSSIAVGTAAAILILLYDVPRLVTKNLPNPEWHLPLYKGAEGLTLVVAILLVLVIALAHSLTKIRRSLKLGLIPIEKYVWAPAITAFWIAYERHNTKTAWGCIVLASLATPAVKLLRRGAIQQGLSPSGLVEGDLPLAEGGEDLLDRRETVESLVSTVLLDPPTVIAVTGAYGDGKTSFLNLAIGEMRKAEGTARPIIVKFSPWLAGDSNAVVLSMLNSIVAEIKREFFVPGLSGDAARYARALLGAAPWTERIKDLFAEPSQERRIEALVTRIEKTGRRVLVVLDDLDRMEAKELETVFKLLRGSDKLSNITFVCAFDPTEVALILKATRPMQDTNLYTEKFFPVGFPLPAIESSQLRQFFTTRLTRVLERSTLPYDDILKKADNEWESGLGLHFQNMRKIKLFFNTINRSLELIAHEVNVWDFVRLQLIRDISPALYGSVFRNHEYFWDRGLAFEHWSRGPQPFDENKAREWRADQYRQIEASVPAEKRQALDLLADLFPNFASYLHKSKKVENPPDAEKNKRIFHPRHFWQYFLLKVPSELFPQKRFNEFMASVKHSDEETAAQAFTEVFRSIIAEDFKRWYFVHLIENRFDEFDQGPQKGLCRGMARNSKLWALDAFEFGTAVNCTYQTLGKIADSGPRQNFLKTIVRESVSDMYALILYWRLKKLAEEGNNALIPDIEAIKPAIVDQLQAHYLNDNPPSVFEQYGNLGSFGVNAIEPIQFLFSWQALGPDAKADARTYLRALLTAHPKDVDCFLRLMFRVDFLDDYSTLKALIDYQELSELVLRYETSLNPKKVTEFRKRYDTDSTASVA